DESKIEASFDRGVLKVMAPKSAEAQKPERKIPIGKS
ncbi:MAG: Hsp20 family protein, partial [Hyphomicrobiaceae bacterium]|nr:Hsp20 family protein [Hyphomicrobiaceae bacterium]